MEHKNRGFYKNSSKAVVTGLQIVIGTLTLFGLILAVSFMANGGMDADKEKSYVETEEYGRSLANDLSNIVSTVKVKGQFEKNGVLDQKQEIDITDDMESYSVNAEKANQSDTDAEKAADSEDKAATEDEADTETTDDSENEKKTEIKNGTVYTFSQLAAAAGNEAMHNLNSLQSDYEYQSFTPVMFPQNDVTTEYYSRLSRDYLTEYWDYLNNRGDYASDIAIDESDKDKNASSLEDYLADIDEALYDGKTEKAGKLNFSADELALAKEVKSLTGESITKLDDKTVFFYNQGKQYETALGIKTAAGTTLAEYALRHQDETSIMQLYKQFHTAAETCNNYYQYTNNDYYDHVSDNVKYYYKVGNNKAYTNVSEWENEKSVYGKHLSEMLPSIWYKVEDGNLVDYNPSDSNAATNEVKRKAMQLASGGGDETVYIGLDNSFPVHDEVYSTARHYSLVRPYINVLISLTGIGLLLSLALLIMGTIQSGRNSKNNELKLYAFDKWPTEVFVVIAGAISALAVAFVIMIIDSFYHYVDDMALVFGLTAASSAAAVVILLFYYCFIRRIKGRSLWKNSLLRKFFIWIKRLFGKGRRGVHNIIQALNTKPKLVVFFIFFVLSHLIAVALFGLFGALLCFAGDMVLLHFILEDIFGRDRVKEGLSHIANGEIDYQIDTAGLRGESLELAEAVNNIGVGLNEAVQQKMKSERLKADLITNVSHDIKTPLTSIINYVHLLKMENIEDPKIRNYIDVLDAKSQRLKQLTEDLVEASKVSSGNVNLSFMNLNLAELAAQMNGEFVERFEAKQLQLVYVQPKEACIVSADSRSLWRVVENLYVNVAKYAMPGTRVYVDISNYRGEIKLTVKNVSENPLNISADELTERFIRGDVSRSTEGSGLGLSIAQNLTKLMHGKFDIYLDGDLFKVTVSFPKVPPKPPQGSQGTPQGNQGTQQGAPRTPQGNNQGVPPQGAPKTPQGNNQGTQQEAPRTSQESPKDNIDTAQSQQ